LFEDHKDIIRRYGFGSLLLFDKCFVPKKFSKWLASLVEVKSNDLIVQEKVISLTVRSVNEVLGIPVGGIPFPSNYSARRDYVLSKIGKSSLPQVSFFASKLKAVDLSDEELIICFWLLLFTVFCALTLILFLAPAILVFFKTLSVCKIMTGQGLFYVGCLMVSKISTKERKMLIKMLELLVVVCSILL
jgi:hypothetical protein